VNGPGEEDELLRSVALQNAQSISLTRQRAEDELVRANEALAQKTQELANSLAMMQATLESTTDGIMATDSQGRITGFNSKFVAMWRLPRELLETGEHRRLLETIGKNFTDPSQFMARVDEIYATSPLESYDLLEMSDGRAFERFSSIQFVGGRNVGRVWSYRDITQRRLTEQALQKHSEWLRVTLASIGDAVITTDTDGRVLFLNDVAQTLIGWKQREAEGRPLEAVFRIVNEHSRQPAANPALRALDEGRVVGLANHTILIAKDGTETPIDDSAAPIRDDHGHIRGAVLVFRDITERKESERALRQSEQELADFFENASIGLHWVGPDGVILRVNRAELTMLGYAHEEYVGRNISDFHVDQDAIANIMRRLTAGETLQDYEARMRCRDGSIKHVLIDSSVLWQDGQFVHTRSFTRDVTDRKRVDEAQARLAAIVESSQDAIVSKTLEGRILSWNKGAEQLFGHTAQEAIGQFITVIIPTERHDEERMILEHVRSGKRIEHFETVRVAKDGRLIDISLTTSPIRASDGRIIGASKIARDISAAKRAERRLVTQNSVTRALAESATLKDAATRIIQTVCEQLGWELGVIWYVDRRANRLRCSDVWHRTTTEVPRFATICRESSFESGIGLPGRVWASARATWIPDVFKDDNFPRGPFAVEGGLHAAFGCPIILNDEVLGVIEFFSREIRHVDEELLQMMAAIGSQIGQFIERKRAEEALRDSEQRFRLMAERVPSIIWTAAPDGAITYANERWFEFCGLTFEQNARRWPELVLHPDDYQRCIASWTLALREGTEYEIEVRNRRHDGVYRWFVTRAVPLRDDCGKIVQWFGTTTDIDDRKRSEQTSRFLADASAALAALTDYKSTLEKVANMAVPYFADWCAVDMLEFDGSLRRLAVAHVDPRKIQLAHELFRRYPPQPSDAHGVMNVLRTGQREWMSVIPDSLLVEATRDEDHLRIARQLGLTSFICVPLRSRKEVLGALTFVTAESGRVYDSNDLAAAEDLTHRAVIAIENANLLAALKESDRRKDEFLAMLAHELRNPLAPIRNSVQILRGRDLTLSQRRWATEVIDRQVHQMTRLVDDLLDISRITRGKIELRKERVELADVLINAVEASRPLIEKWGHELTVSVADEPIVLYADPARLAQVFQNLLNNAAKYMDQGGHIWVSAERQDDRAVVRVLDTGIGIPPEMLPRIFDMFTQVDHSLDRAEGGLGLGLTLVQRLVEMHGGSVSAHSEGLGQGSEFVVRLPIAASVQIEELKSAGESTKPRALGSRRILIVDDNRDAADTLALLLRDMGNIVHTAYDGLEAVAAAATYQPEIILLDIGLPKLNGYDAARRIRESPGGADMLLIALTGWGQDEDRRRSREAGFDHHMTKPVGFATLEKLLAEAKSIRG
jgi:PAS domain S-box-containing protein